MKKVKMFFLLASLTLITIAVSAGRNKFAAWDLYASDGISIYHLDDASTFFDLTTSSGFSTYQAKISGSFTTLGLYAYDLVSGMYVPLYPIGF